MTHHRSETDLARVVVHWLESLGLVLAGELAVVVPPGDGGPAFVYRGNGAVP